MKFEVDDNKMLIFSEYLRNLRYENNYTLDYLKSQTGIGISDINQLENGLRKKINPMHLIALANIYKINVLKFYEMLGYVNKNNITEYIKKEAIEDNIDKIFEEKTSKYATIPLFKDIELIEDNTNIPDAYIQVPLENSEKYRAIHINENTMEPTLKNPGIVIFNPDVKNLANSDIGIFKLNNIFLIKRFYKNNEDIILQSDNPLFLPIIVKNKDNFKIIGKCVGSFGEI